MDVIRSKWREREREMNILLIGSNLDISVLYETRLKGRGQVLFNCILSYISSVRKIFSVKKNRNTSERGVFELHLYKGSKFVQG